MVAEADAGDIVFEIQEDEHVDDYNEVQTLHHQELLRRQDEFVSSIVREMNSFDNVILEICDGPASYGTPRYASRVGRSLD